MALDAFWRSTRYPAGCECKNWTARGTPLLLREHRKRGLRSGPLSKARSNTDAESLRPA